jgi:outer membrane protein TolC
MGDSDFVDYLLGLVFEYPLGNRAAEAAFRQARLQRTSAVVGYQQAVQIVVLDVKRALRDVITFYELIMATRSFRVAQAENLRPLLVEEQTMAGLTPEFLNLKFQRQETLAQARQQEIGALANFDKSLAALYRAMGTGLKMKGIDFEVELDNSK